MNADKRLTATVPLIGMDDRWEQRYLDDCVRMGADSVLLVAPYDNIVRSKRKVRYAMFSEEALPPVPEQRVCDLPAIELVEHWAEVFSQLAPKYRAKGIEPYFWLGHSLGHGGELSAKSQVPFQVMVGADGDEAPGCFCPLDEAVKQYLVDVVTTLAKAGIPLILLDDDFRVNYHMPGVDIGCFCPKHMERFNRENGTGYTRRELAELVYAGGDIRAKFLKMAGDSLLELAQAIEQAVHKVNPNTRLGLATAMIHYSSEGYDIRQMAKVLAGPTRPYLRVFGAPYHVKNNPMQLGFTVDTAKHLADHLSGHDIEIIGEGDTYPHTRFFTNRTALQTHLLASRCSGVRNMLHYPFCFAASPDFETIYVETAQKLRPAMAMLDQLLPETQAATGIQPVLDFGNLNHIPISRAMTRRERVWPDEPMALKMLSQFGIPTVPARQAVSQPVLLAGYNGFGYTDEQLNIMLDRGAIIDATAAKWLLRRGFDIGLESVTDLDAVPTFEEFCGRFSGRYQGEQVWLLCPGDTPFFALAPKAEAQVTGWYINGTDGSRTPSCVAYEKASRKIFTLGFDFFSVRASFQAVSNVARAEQMRNVCRWLGVDIFVENQEFLYINAYRQENTRTVCLVQTNTDKTDTVCLYLKDSPARELCFYTQDGQRQIHYQLTGSTLTIDHVMAPGDLLVVTYTA